MAKQNAYSAKTLPLGTCEILIYSNSVTLSDYFKTQVWAKTYCFLYYDTNLELKQNQLHGFFVIKGSLLSWSQLKKSKDVRSHTEYFISAGVPHTVLPNLHFS